MPNGNGRGRYQDRAFVTIRCDPDGDITLSEDPIYIRRRGRIDWQCDDGDWTVTVDDPDDPFDEGREVEGKKGQRKGVRVRNDANQNQPDGRDYKYTVRVRLEAGTAEKDPDIVVGPDEPPDDDNP